VPRDIKIISPKILNKKYVHRPTKSTITPIFQTNVNGDDEIMTKKRLFSPKIEKPIPRDRLFSPPNDTVKPNQKI